MSEIFLSLGSNIGNRRQFIERAIDLLADQVKLIRQSNIYETSPWGNTNQPRFLNLCLSGETDLSARDLLAFLKKIEANLGRSYSEKWGPREIDIDILFYDSQIINAPGLNIPHTHLHERAFVLIPLNEIAADFMHPIFKKKISQLAENIDRSGINLYET